MKSYIIYYCRFVRMVGQDIYLKKTNYVKNLMLLLKKVLDLYFQDTM